MGWLSVLGTIAGGALGGPLGAAIGGGLTGGAEGAMERSRINKYNRGQAEAMKYAPWTNFKPQFRDNDASMFGGLAQGAAIGALTGGAIQKMFGLGGEGAQAAAAAENASLSPHISNVVNTPAGSLSGETARNLSSSTLGMPDVTFQQGMPNAAGASNVGVMQPVVPYTPNPIMTPAEMGQAVTPASRGQSWLGLTEYGGKELAPTPMPSSWLDNFRSYLTY